MWAPNPQAGKIYRGMRADLNAIDARVATPGELVGWSPSTVHDLLDAWGFESQFLKGGGCLRWHPQHPDLDVTIPATDPVQLEGVVRRVVTLVETLVDREGLAAGPPEGSRDRDSYEEAH